MRRWLSALGAVLVIGLVTSCASDDAPPADRSTAIGPSAAVEPTPEPAIETPLVQALDRIDPAAAEGLFRMEFSQYASLFELAGSDQRWQGAAGLGGRVSQYQHLLEEMGMQPTSADYVLAVGQLPTGVTLVAGGQDADAVTAGAQAMGYAGTDELTQQLNPSEPITVSFQKVLPVGQDVVLATMDADLAWVDGGGSLLEQHQAGSVAQCLGDVLGAVIVDYDGEIVGVGVRADGTDVISVVCIPGTTAIADQVEQDVADLPFGQSLTVTDVQEVSGLVQVTILHEHDQPADLMFGVLHTYDLPGM